MTVGPLIYLDNAATTFPKPREVLMEMIELYAEHGVSPGRGSYDLAVQAEELVSEIRRQTARFFGSDDWEKVIFTSNATDALNLVIQGVVQPGDHVISSRLEHNSVLRPLHHLLRQGIIELDLVSFDGQGFIDPDDVARAIKPQTCCVVLTHASNVLGTIQPVAAVGKICHDRGVPLIVDVAQSAGLVPMDMAAWNISAVAFTGHKSLMAPSGIGGLVLSPDLDVRATRFGGTGVDSQSLEHTPSYPHRLEAGSINIMGVIGLGAALRRLEREGLHNAFHAEMKLIRRLRDGLADINRVRLYAADRLDNHLPLLPFNIHGLDPDTVGDVLDGDFNIACRVGLHCAPLVHESLGTNPRGTVRFSLGP
jgi:cysteine desulfurase family protein